MKDIFIKLSKIPKDKLLHYFYGSLISFFVYALNIGIMPQIIVVGIFAIGKEFFDEYANAWDVFWTMLPIFILTLIELI
jgi:hypothetical protein